MKHNKSNIIARQPRISDVAKIAGVSTATVSRVLSDAALVSAETREKVLSAVAQTNYRINQMARNLRRNKTGSIVVLVPYLANPFFSRILSAIAHVASQHGVNVLIVDTREAHGSSSNIAQYLDDNRCDGLIVLDANLPEDLFKGARRPPVVFACEWLEEHGYPSVMIDNKLGAEMAVEYLIKLGHRHIGHIKGIEHNVLTDQRLAGVAKAFENHAMALDDLVLFEGNFSLDAGINAAKEWLALRNRPTGIFCASDVMAFGFISELHRNGLSVPNDVSVIGFDDIEISAQFLPALTTVHQPRHQIGERAAELLFELIEAGPTKIDVQFEPEVLPIELVVRSSCAPAA